MEGLKQKGKMSYILTEICGYCPDITVFQEKFTIIPLLFLFSRKINIYIFPFNGQKVEADNEGMTQFL
jgi:hypothetical protein